MNMKSDIEIARENNILDIKYIADKLDLNNMELAAWTTK